MSAPDHFQDLPAGQFLKERYRIKRTLGRGNFGITYEAADMTLERPVAIKESLPRQFAMREHGRTVVLIDEDQRENFEWARDRFLDEAKVLARFDHPNIVRIIDYFTENDTAYFVMPYLEGASLTAVIEEHGKFGLKELRTLIFPLLDGLRQVHASDILHRDIKPDNIWITQQGVPMLLDFGAARQAIGLKSHEVTSIATASYAPLEQLAGEEGSFGPYTDIYALGGVIYKAVTGCLPPPANRRAREDLYEPMASPVANFPAHVAAAVDWALALHESARPQNVDEWLEALEGKRTVPPPGGSGRIAIIVTAVVVVAAVIAAGGILLSGAVPGHKPGSSGETPGGKPSPAGEVRGTKSLETSLAGKQAGEVRDFEVIKNVFVRCCWCPPGTFNMGSSPEEARQLAESGAAPEEIVAGQRPVTLPEGFWMAKYETTADELKDIQQALHREIFAPLHPKDPPASLPAASLSWNRSVEICAALDSENPFPGWEIRLPTEQEWEYACRAGTVTTYSFGSALNGSEANCDGNRPFPRTNTGPGRGPHLARVARGGSYPPNPWGICDLHGNLAEWCQDRFVAAPPVGSAGAPTSDVSAADHVLRGGSWDSAARNCRSAARLGGRADYEADTIGFRLVLARRPSP